MSTEGNNSESSGSSSNQLPFFQSDLELSDLTLVGCAAPVFSRTGTVRRASKKDSPCLEDQELEASFTGNTRKSRSSLESISEYKITKKTSLDSTSSDHTENALRSSTVDKEDKTLLSPSSSYLSWIESVNSDYFTSAVSSAEVPDVDSKVGEWNNFWLNYNSARSKYLSNPYLSVSNEDRTGDDLSEVKSTCSTQKEFNDKNSVEYVSLTLDEVHETVKCSQRILEILQNALRRGDHELEDSNNESFYSQQNSIMREDDMVIMRERSFSYAVDAQDLQKQKQMLKPAPQSSSTSCINALLNNGVADILKRVISKRRDVMASDDLPSITRSSFSEWSSAK